MAKFVVRQNASLQYHFNLQATNGEKMLSSETYTTKQAALNGISSVKINAPYDVRYQKLTSKRGLPYFVLRGANNEVLGVSEEYSAIPARDVAIATVKVLAPTAPIEDLTVTPIRTF